ALALVELDAETEAGLIGIGFGGDVRAPDAIALLEAKRVDGLVSARDKPKLVARLPDRVPQPQPKLGRAIQLPAQLADIRDAKRETRDAADRDLARGHEREGVVADVGRRQPPENRPGRRPPEPAARVRRRHVSHLDRP